MVKGGMEIEEVEMWIQTIFPKNLARKETEEISGAVAGEKCGSRNFICFCFPKMNDT